LKEVKETQRLLLLQMTPGEVAEKLGVPAHWACYVNIGRIWIDEGLKYPLCRRKPDQLKSSYSPATLLAIRKEVDAGVMSRNIAKKYGVSEAFMSGVKHGKWQVEEIDRLREKLKQK
jgi:hypothetical protein